MEAPDSLESTATRLQAALPQDYYVGTGYSIEFGNPEWILVVYSNKDKSSVPSMFEGFHVAKRDIPQAQ